MDKLRIIGGHRLEGQIHISGAKNAALPLMTACLLTNETLELVNVPKLSDINVMSELLEQHGVEGGHRNTKGSFYLKAANINNTTAPYDIVRKMRASILVLGPLLARCGYAKVSLPGGCAIGARPVDFHIRGLIALGAEIELESGYIIAKAPRGLKGAEFAFPIPSVTGTENLMMAACLAKGQTKLINVAREPEIIDLGKCLIAMGASVEGLGGDIITIEGVDLLHGATHKIMSDRIEAGTYAVAAAITHGKVELINTHLDDLPTFIPLLKEAGVIITPTDTGMVVSADGLKSADIMIEPFPGFPTDLQAQFMALMTQSEGASMITETIWENRFMHVPELSRLGANITIHGSSALVRGKTPLRGAPVMATDLRASFSLVLAGLSAQGETMINRLYHLDRGYEDVEAKLLACGAQIERLKETDELF